MTSTNSTLPAPHLFTREVFIDLLNAGLAVRNYRFVRDAAMVWLSNYPGDLMVGWFYGQSLAGDGRYKQAIPILKGLCMADPEFEEPLVSLSMILSMPEADLTGELTRHSIPDLLAGLFVLTGEETQSGKASSWGKELRLARLALAKGGMNLAEESIRRALIAEPASPIAAVTHLQFLAANPAVRLENKLVQARRYQRQWPDCLACGIYLAEWLMAGDDPDQAVALIHQAVARDISGQVAQRIWGAGHPYSHLWPDKLELGLEIPVPAEVAAFLGWNRLPGASAEGIGEYLNFVPLRLDNEDNSLSADVPPVNPAPLMVEENLPGFPQNAADESTPVMVEDEQETWIEWMNASDEARAKAGSQPDMTAVENQSLKSAGHQPASSEAELDLEFESETLKSVQEEIELLAERLHIHRSTQTEKRFPIYVVFSLRSRLEAEYGESMTALLLEEMNRLARVVAGQRGWGARLFIPDDPANIKELAIKAPRPSDAWELKLALADLDEELAKRGEMIGALLIVGGPEIVPFHRLPNPLDDPDLDVPSDNPYATRDENYFIPEWPVGRLPGGSGADARFLLAALKRITAHQTELQAHNPWYQRVVDWFRDLVKPARRAGRLGFGYSAAIWKQAAASVFNEIGEPKEMYISPPCGLAGDTLEDYLDDLDFSGKPNENIPAPIGAFGYFNLHGVVDAVEWFGHRDPLKPEQAPEFPIALRPQDLRAAPLGKYGGFPRLVFSEACYGAHIDGKSLESAMAYKFLESGTLALVGSTCMSYGSIMGSLSAADLLAKSFWRFSRAGFPAGEALRQAKIEMIKQMDQEQGFLDGQDQKTLLSFVLYGDPLAQVMKSTRSRKAVERSMQPLAHFEIVCDRAQDCTVVPSIPDNVLSQVRQVVAQYLPGMSGARVAMIQEQPACKGLNHQCPTSQLVSGKNPESLHQAGNCKTGAEGRPGPATRDLVTLCKMVKSPHGVHPYYAHLTLEHGKLVKLVVSR